MTRSTTELRGICFALQILHPSCVQYKGAGKKNTLMIPSANCHCSMVENTKLLDITPHAIIHTCYKEKKKSGCPQDSHLQVATPLDNTSRCENQGRPATSVMFVAQQKCPHPRCTRGGLPICARCFARDSVLLWYLPRCSARLSSSGYPLATISR